MELLRQVGGCFTTTTCVQMFTGKLPSDLEENGIGYELCGKYRNPISGDIYWPWENQMLVNRLRAQDWQIRLHNGNWFSGQFLNNNPNAAVMSTAFPGGLEAESKKTWGDKGTEQIMLGHGPDTVKFYADEAWSIRQMQAERSIKNTFYFVKYDQFHVATLQGSGKLVAAGRLVELMRQWDFNEPDAMFWFFSDHSDWNTMTEHPHPNHYLLWALFKDNTAGAIKARSNFISARDFFSTVMNKFGYSYEPMPDVRSIQENQDLDRIYYTEDGRQRFDKNNSTTAIACRFIDWDGIKPCGLLQVSYFKPRNEFVCMLAHLNSAGFVEDIARLNEIDSRLKQALIDRFEWVDGEPGLVKGSVGQQLCSPQEHHHLQSSGKQCSIIFTAGKDLSDFKLYVRVMLAHGLPDGYEIIIINDAGMQINGQWLKSMPSSVKVVKPVETTTFERKCRQAAIEAEGKYLLLLKGLVRFDLELVRKSVMDCETSRIKLSISPDNRCILVERSHFLHLETPGADMRQALVQSCSEKVFS